ncbi:MAG: peptidoglycan-binding protein, partial [Oscillospiraceae bacterium]|nr:peptidoglycan-binding protein [Oscillospiraceae bacterium]
TAAAVRKMQRIVGCYADGVFGPETRRRTMSPAQCNYDY